MDIGSSVVIKRNEVSNFYSISHQLLFFLLSSKQEESQYGVGKLDYPHQMGL